MKIVWQIVQIFCFNVFIIQKVLHCMNNQEEANIQKPNQSDSMKMTYFTDNQPKLYSNGDIQKKGFQIPQQIAKNDDVDLQNIEKQQNRTAEKEKDIMMQKEKNQTKKQEVIVGEEVHEKQFQQNQKQQTQFSKQIVSGDKNVKKYEIKEKADYAPISQEQNLSSILFQLSESKKKIDQLVITLDNKTLQINGLNKLIQDRTNCLHAQELIMQKTVKKMNQKMTQLQIFIQSQAQEPIQYNNKLMLTLQDQKSNHSRQLAKINGLYQIQKSKIVQMYARNCDQIEAKKDRQNKRIAEQLDYRQNQCIKLQNQIYQFRCCSGNIIRSFQKQHQAEIINSDNRQQILREKHKQLLKELQTISLEKLIPALKQVSQKSDLANGLLESNHELEEQINSKDKLIQHLKQLLTDRTQAQTQRQNQIQLLQIQKQEIQESNRLLIETLTIQANSVFAANLNHNCQVYEYLMKDLIAKHKEETTANQYTIKSLQEQLEIINEVSNLRAESLMEDIEQKKIEMMEQQQEYNQTTAQLKSLLRKLQSDLINKQEQSERIMRQMTVVDQKIKRLEDYKDHLANIFFFLQNNAKQRTYQQIFDNIYNVSGGQEYGELIDTIKIFYYKENLISQKLQQVRDKLQVAEERIKELQKNNYQTDNMLPQKIQPERDQPSNKNAIFNKIIPPGQSYEKELLILKDQTKIMNKKYNQTVNQFEKTKKQKIGLQNLIDELKNKNQQKRQTIRKHEATIQNLNNQIYSLSNKKKSSLSKERESDRDLKQIDALKSSKIEMLNKIKLLQTKIQQIESTKQYTLMLKEQLDQLQRDRDILNTDNKYYKDNCCQLEEKMKQCENQNQQFLQQIQNLQSKIYRLSKQSSSIISAEQNSFQYLKHQPKKIKPSKIQTSQVPIYGESPPITNQLFTWVSLIEKIPVGKSNLMVIIEQYCKSPIKNTNLLFHSNETIQNISTAFSSLDIKFKSLALLMKNGKNYFAIAAIQSKYQGASQCFLISLTTGKVVYPKKGTTVKGFRFESFGPCIGDKQYIIQIQGKTSVIKSPASSYFQPFARQQIFGEQNSKQENIKLDELQIHRINFE